MVGLLVRTSSASALSRPSRAALTIIPLLSVLLPGARASNGQVSKATYCRRGPNVATWGLDRLAVALP